MPENIIVLPPSDALELALQGVNAAPLPTVDVEGTRAFAPPMPITLPTLVLDQRIAGPPGSALAAWYRNLATVATRAVGAALILLTPTDIAPEPSVDDPGVRPPPRLPPGADDPLTPPNWDELSRPPADDAFPTRDLPFPDLPELPELPEFVVSPPQPQPYAPPLEVPFVNPFANPFGQPFGFPYADPGPGPGTGPAITPGPAPAPAVPTTDPAPWGLPDLDPQNDPAPDLFPAPSPFPAPGPSPSPFPSPDFPTFPFPQPPAIALPAPVPAPRAPDLIIDDPFRPLIADPFRVPEIQPLPDRFRADPCDCDRKPKKPKEKKKPKEREVCYRGTYVQRKKGISYKRLEEVPCEEKPATRKKKAPGLSLNEQGGTLLDYLGQLAEGSDLIDQVLGRTLYKPKKPTRLKKGRKPKTTVPRVPGSIYTSPFPQYGD